MYHGTVTANQFKHWLAKRGCTFEEGAKHTKVMHQGQFTFLPRHPAEELKASLIEGIKKRLGLK